MKKCENCRWDIPDDASSCPYCGHRFYLNEDEEEERRRLLLRGHMLNMMRQRKRYAAPGALSVVSALVQGVARASIAVSVTAMTVVVLTGVVFVAKSARTEGITTGVPPVSTPSPYVCIPGAEGAGTDLLFAFSGATSGTMCILENFKCSIYTTATAYQFDLHGVVNGIQYDLFVDIESNYHGPAIYEDHRHIILNSFGTGTTKQWEASMKGASALIKVNGDEKSGDILARLTPLKTNSPGTSPGTGNVLIRGNWVCSTLERNP